MVQSRIFVAGLLLALFLSLTHLAFFFNGTKRGARATYSLCFVYGKTRYSLRL